jgi:hypothetical protein
MTKDNSPSTPYVPLFFSAMKSAKLFTSRRALMLQQSSSIACHSTLTLLDFARSLELGGCTFFRG